MYDYEFKYEQHRDVTGGTSTLEVACTWPTVKGYMRNGQKIDAIKRMREIIPGLGLRDAKEAIEMAYPDYRSPVYTPTETYMIVSNHGPTRHVHPNYKSACDEAERLAKKQPNSMFTVVKRVKSYYNEQVTYNTMKEEVL